MNTSNRQFRGLTKRELSLFAAQSIVAALRGIYRRHPSSYTDVMIAVRSPLDSNTIVVNSPRVDFSRVEVGDLIKVRLGDNKLRADGLDYPKIQMALTAFQENPERNALVLIRSADSEAFSILGRELAPLGRDSALWFARHAVFDLIYGSSGASGAVFRNLISIYPYVLVKSEGVLVCESSLARAITVALAGDRACRLQLAVSHIPEISLIPEHEISSINEFEMSPEIVDQNFTKLTEH
ncbi:MAG: class II aldolase/adducin family protein [Pseudomonadales bacterium]|jgi:ribulose-5-phosphate 4-epimerase/fuculose-1-phosphate aldolase